MIFLYILVPFLGVYALTFFLASSFSPLKIYDSPNARSLHTKLTPRTGGIAIIIGIVISWIFILGKNNIPEIAVGIIIATGIITIVSLLDDFLNLPVLLRLAVHFGAVAVFLFFIRCSDWDWWRLLLNWVAIVWMLNLYNFMDGMDGFAGGMGLFGFAFLAISGWFAGSGSFFYLALIVAAANGGFLILNFPPAKIFMGDVGSATMGFLAGAFSIWGIQEKFFPWWFPVLVFSPFIVDASVTLIRRCLKKEKIWKAHKTHYYQRLVQLGWGHKRTVIIEYSLMAITGLSALFLLKVSNQVQYFFLVFWSVVYCLLVVFVKALERRVKNKTVD